jgi:hypothetical protein
MSRVDYVMMLLVVIAHSDVLNCGDVVVCCCGGVVVGWLFLAGQIHQQ